MRQTTPVSESANLHLVQFSRDGQSLVDDVVEELVVIGGSVAPHSRQVQGEETQILGLHFALVLNTLFSSGTRELPNALRGSIQKIGEGVRGTFR